MPDPVSTAAPRDPRVQAVAEALDAAGFGIAKDRIAEVAVEALGDTQPLPPLVSRAEVAEVLGCHRNNLYRDHPDLPTSEGLTKAGPVWRRSTIEKYAADRAAGEK